MNLSLVDKQTAIQTVYWNLWGKYLKKIIRFNIGVSPLADSFSDEDDFRKCKES